MGQFVTEARNQLAQIELSFWSQIAAVQGRRHISFSFAQDVIVVFGLLQFEVQVKPHALGVVKEDLPLVQPRAVVMHFIFRRDKRPRLFLDQFVCRWRRGIKSRRRKWERFHRGCPPGLIIFRFGHGR